MFELLDLIRAEFEVLERELEALREWIMKLPDRYDIDSLKTQVAVLAEGMHEIEQRVTKLEEHKSWATLVFFQLATVAAIVLIIYLLYLVSR